MDVDLEDANNGDHWSLGVLSLLDNTLYVYDSMQMNDDKISEIQLKNWSRNYKAVILLFMAN